MSQPTRRYLPAAGRDWLLPFYDLVTWLLGADAARRALVEQAEILSRHQVLDVGCGTGTLAVELALRFPEAGVHALDPDPRALARAARKANRAGAGVRFQRGFADALPHPPATFDRVLSSFAFHHVPRSEQEGAYHEVRRVLKPGGRFHLLDFGGDASAERVLARMRAAGFDAPRVLGRRRALRLEMRYYAADVPV